MAVKLDEARIRLLTIPAGRPITLSAGKVSHLASGSTNLYSNGIAISNPTTSNDVGFIRVTGTGESDTVLEIATGDDAAEKIVARQYNTSNAVAREAVLLNTNGTTSFPVSVTAPSFIGALNGNAATATKATKDSDGNQINTTYVKKSGSEMSNLNALTASASTTANISPNANAIASSPFARDLWHDHLAFLAGGHEIRNNQVSTDGSTWINDTLDLTPLFAQKETTTTTILSASQLARRFTIYSSNIAYSMINWYEIGVAYTSPYSQFNIRIESSNDGSTWVNIHQSTITSNSAPYFLKGNSLGGNPYLRFTFTKTTNTTTGSVSLTCIKAYTTRKGNQGLGINNEYPYDWNASRDIYPHSDNSRSLGLSNKRWKNVYATTFHGALNGNANTATALTSSAGSTTQPIYFSNGKPVAITGNIANGTTGNAATATALTSNAGSSSQPVYFSGGKPVAITGNIANGTTGNAATATKLATARTINGTNFDGSGNITTTNWGTARTVTIGNTGKSVNGSGNVSWSLSEIAGNNYFAFAKANTSGTMNDAAKYYNAMGMINLSAPSSGTASYVNPNGQTSWHHFINISYQDGGAASNSWITQIANKAGTTDLWVRSRSGGTISNDTAWGAPWTRILTGSNYSNVLDSVYINTSGDTMTGALNFKNNTWNNVGDDVAMGDANQSGKFCIKGLNGATGIYFAPYSGSTAQTITINGSGTMTITGTIASTFSGNLTGNVTGNVSGSSGSCTGNAATATKLATKRTISLAGSVTGSGTFDGSGNLSIATTTNHTHSYLPLSGGTMTGQIWSKTTNYSTFSFTKGTAPTSTQYRELKFIDNTMKDINTSSLGLVGCQVDTNNTCKMKMNAFAPISGNSASASIYVQSDADGNFSSGSTCVFYGAVWNDYAEFRQSDDVKPGYVVTEKGDDTLAVTTSRMMPACSIVSDTFGFAIGETEKCKTPLAQAGRVLAYPYEDRDSYKPGDAVCSAPDGKVSKMTQEEKVNHPECIVGYVSCVPNYEIWGEHDTKVNGRIWIKVK